MIVTRLMALVIGYFCGCFPTGYMVGKTRGVDIRKHGSGNTGATNTLRTLGWRAAALTFFGDCAKTILAIIIVSIAFSATGFDMKILQLYAGLGAVLGHNFPFYFKFKGGKGIASTFGLILSFHPWFIPMGVIVFLGIFMTTHYVSLGSLLIYAGFVIQMLIMGQAGRLGEISQGTLNEMYVITFLLMIMAYWKHRENIKRLLTGTERKTYLFKKNKVD